jgi:hypothetical protein
VHSTDYADATKYHHKLIERAVHGVPDGEAHLSCVSPLPSDCFPAGMPPGWVAALQTALVPIHVDLKRVSVIALLRPRK